MRCDRIAPHLKTYLDGETSTRQTVGIRRHLRHCPACAAQLREWQSLDALLRSSDLFAASANSAVSAASSTVAAIPAILPALSGTDRVGPTSNAILKGKTAMRLKLVTGLSAAALALIVLSGWGRHSMSMAAEIRRAVGGVNTWHLKGWKLQNGKQIPWEVWGRRAPFFYREQIGQDTIVDDGVRRVSLFAPLGRADSGKTEGIVLRVPSFPDARNRRWSLERLQATWNRNRTPESQTAEQATFNDYERAGLETDNANENRDIRTTVSKQTWLPTRFEVQAGRPGAMRTLALLSADYNKPLPPQTLTLSAAPPRWITYDATQPAPPVGNAVSANGVTVQAMPLVAAPDGSLLLRLKTWVGSRLIRRGDTLHCDVTTQTLVEPRTESIRDDQGRIYTEVHWDTLGFAKRDDSVLLLFAPAAPLAPHAPLPTRLTLPLNVNAYLETRMIDSLNANDDARVMAHKITLTLPLPAPSAPIEQAAPGYINADLQRSTLRFAGSENLAAATALARANHYGANQDPRSADLSDLRRSADYFEAYINCSSLPSGLNVARERAARLCVQIGDRPRARRLLQAILDDTRPDAHLSATSDTITAQGDANMGRQILSNGTRHLEAERKQARAALASWAR